MDVVVGRAHCNLMRGIGVVLHTADIGSQLYRGGGRCLLGGPGLRITSWVRCLVHINQLRFPWPQ